MQERKPTMNGYGKLLGVTELRQYLSLGAKTARTLGADAGAEVHVGRRVLYDREKIDRYVNQLAQ